MEKLNRFLSVLVLCSLVLSPIWSDVTLTDEEAQQILTDLENCEKFSTQFEIQSTMWLEELDNLSLMLSRSEELQKSQQKYYEQQLRAQKKQTVKTAIIVGSVALVLGAIVGGGIVIAIK